MTNNKKNNDGRLVRRRKIASAEIKLRIREYTKSYQE